MPPSRTSRLLPRPMNVTGMPRSCAKRRPSLRSSSSAGSNQSCAGPPMRIVVCLCSGSSRLRMLSGFNRPLSSAYQAEALREMLRDAMNVPRAQRDDQVARLEHRIHRRAQPAQRRLVTDLGVPVRAHPLGDRLAGDARHGRFARGINFGDENLGPRRGKPRRIRPAAPWCASSGAAERAPAPASSRCSWPRPASP